MQPTRYLNAANRLGSQLPLDLQNADFSSAMVACGLFCRMNRGWHQQEVQPRAALAWKVVLGCSKVSESDLWRHEPFHGSHPTEQARDFSDNVVCSPAGI